VRTVVRLQMRAPCVLQERGNELLADPTGRIHPQLQLVFDTLMGVPRPQTPIYWFNRSAGPCILRAMARARSRSPVPPSS
jgi:hypothetical protein